MPKNISEWKAEAKFWKGEAEKLSDAILKAEFESQQFTVSGSELILDAQEKYVDETSIKEEDSDYE